MSDAASEDRLTIAHRGTLYELTYSEYVNLSVRDFLAAVRAILNLNQDSSILICARNGSLPDLDLESPLASLLETIGNDRYLIALVRDGHELPSLPIEKKGGKVEKAGPQDLLFVNPKEVGSFQGSLTGEYRGKILTIGTKYLLIPFEMISMIRRYAEEDKTLIWINRFLGVFFGACVSLIVPLVDATNLSAPVRGALFGGTAVSMIAVVSLLFIAGRVESKARTGREEFERVVGDAS